MRSPLGSVVLYHRPTTWANFRRDPFGTFMTALIHLTTRSKWNHAALSLGDGKVVEATSDGVKVSPLPDPNRLPDETTLTIPVAYDDDEDREDAMAYAAGRVGTEYGELNAFVCGLRNVLPGRLQVKWGDTVICSELVAEALVRAGHPGIDKDPALYSPGDLADLFGAPRK